jgi:hypothetical protein
LTINATENPVLLVQYGFSDEIRADPVAVHAARGLLQQQQQQQTIVW